MKRAGMYMMIIGAFTAVLPVVGMQSRIFGFLDSWGPTTGWAIKIGLIVIGAVLYFRGSTNEDTKSEQA